MLYGYVQPHYPIHNLTNRKINILQIDLVYSKDNNNRKIALGSDWYPEIRNCNQYPREKEGLVHPKCKLVHVGE